MATETLCKIDGCNKPIVNGRGWCGMHYRRWRIHGDPLVIKVTPIGDPMRFIIENALPYTGDACIVWPYARGRTGEARAHIDGQSQLVSRYICAKVNGPPPTPEHHAAHSCGKGHEACITPKHLSWKTPLENKADELIHGTRNHGERNGGAKLSAADVSKIRSLRGAMPQRGIAELFNVSEAAIYNIFRGKSWATQI